MLKHATISRTSRAQQTLQLQRHWQRQDQEQQSPQIGCNQQEERVQTPTTTTVLTTTTATTPTSISLTSTPTKSSNNSHNSSNNNSSMIKIYAQTLNQEVEYITLHVNTQTKSQQIIKTLLRKFRLKHRDPNLFHLTLERWIRKDGLKFKSVMLLGDEACPLQLQQCCSNPPYNDIKFTLQKRSGTLVKIYCSDVVPNAKYKSLILSTQTTVDETIELMLYCLNLASQSTNNHTTVTPTATTATTIDTHHHRNNHHRHHQHQHQRSFSSSPNSSQSTSSACSSSSSDTSSSSGIESEPNNINISSSCNSKIETRLDSDSRASSVTSISSSSNVSSLSSSLIDQYCLVIECKDSNFERVLHPDEYLVDIYQSLLAEAGKTTTTTTSAAATHSGHQSIALNNNNLEDSDSGTSSLTNHISSSTLLSSTSDPLISKQLPDQWFLIKLKRRYEITENNYNCHHQATTINYVSPRQNIPLPPIPGSLIKQKQQQQQSNNNNHLRHFVSTTQIEVNRPGSSLAISSSSQNDSSLMREIMGSTPITIASHSLQSQQQQQQQQQHLATAAVALDTFDEVDSSTTSLPEDHQQDHHQTPPPIIWLTPPVRPRRRNLSNVSSTFGRPMVNNNRRRYDPAQLAQDLDRLNIIGGSGCGPVAPVAAATATATATATASESG